MSEDTIDWQGVRQIAIVVHDLESQVAFYRDTLGLPYLFQIPNSAFFDAGNMRLMLSRPEKPEFDHPPSTLYYRVGDIHAAHRILASRGVRFEGEPHFLAKMPDHDLWMAFFYDPEGNLMALMSEVR